MSSFINEEHRIILKTFRGSYAYGISISEEQGKILGLPPSDIDTHCMIIPPKRYVLSCGYVFGNNRFESLEKDQDIVHTLHKFAKLAIACSPTVIEMLFVKPEHVIKVTEIGQKLIEYRNLFLSKKAYFAFRGYAKTDFESLYRGPRKDLVARFGYDVKRAANCLRVLTSGVQILTEGKYDVYSPHREFLMKIKIGELSLEEVEDLYYKWNQELDKAFQQSSLPERPNIEAVEDLIVSLHEEFWRNYEEKKER